MTENKVVDKIQEFIHNETFITLDGRDLKVSDYFKKENFILVDDSPFIKLDALTKVSRKVFHRILSYIVNVEQSPNKSTDGCAVVKVLYEVEFGDRKFIGSAAADCSSKNSKGNTGKYPIAMAESRANARALRNILGINICSYEELSGNDSEEIIKTDGPIDPSQKMLIEKKFLGEKGKTLKDISEILGKNLNTIEEMTKLEASLIIGHFNKEKIKS